jgi:4,5-epoxidase
VPVAQLFLLADVHADWPTERSGTGGWFTRGGALLAFPLRDVGEEEDLWRLIVDVSLDEEAGLDDQAILERFRQLLPVRTGLTNVRIRDACWTSAFRIHRRLADHYRRGRMVLAGDAAHVHSVIGGQGMLTGILDAENLA